MILSELCDRAKSAQDAQTMADSSVFPLVDELLASPDMAVRRSTCWMVGNLARHERTVVISTELCLRLVSALRDETLELKESAAHQLYWVTHPPSGALHAIQLAWVAKFCSNVKRCGCHILASLACHATAQSILGAKAHQQLGRNVNGMDIAANTLIWISRLPRGAQAATNTNVLACVTELLDSPVTAVRRWTCALLSVLAGHDIAAAVFLDARLCSQLVSLTRRHPKPAVCQSAAFTLASLTTHPDGAAVVSATDFEACVPRLIKGSNRMRLHTRTIVENLGTFRGPGTREPTPPRRTRWSRDEDILFRFLGESFVGRGREVQDVRRGS
ncbi:armadillo-type protein [Mycena vulgaris]|nr:armadillo-type protein [Mycena vulgaris]